MTDGGGDEADLESALLEKIRYIGETREKARRDEVEDLRQLERDVAALCDRITALPPGEARSFEPLMAEMIGGLESLAEELQAFRARLEADG